MRMAVPWSNCLHVSSSCCPASSGIFRRMVSGLQTVECVNVKLSVSIASIKVLFTHILAMHAQNAWNFHLQQHVRVFDLYAFIQKLDGLFAATGWRAPLICPILDSTVPCWLRRWLFQRRSCKSWNCPWRGAPRLLLLWMRWEKMRKTEPQMFQVLPILRHTGVDPGHRVQGTQSLRRRTWGERLFIKAWWQKSKLTKCPWKRCWHIGWPTTPKGLKPQFWRRKDWKSWGTKSKACWPRWWASRGGCNPRWVRTLRQMNRAHLTRSGLRSARMVKGFFAGYVEKKHGVGQAANTWRVPSMWKNKRKKYCWTDCSECPQGGVLEKDATSQQGRLWEHIGDKMWRIWSPSWRRRFKLGKKSDSSMEKVQNLPAMWLATKCDTASTWQLSSTARLREAITTTRTLAMTSGCGTFSRRLRMRRRSAGIKRTRRKVTNGGPSSCAKWMESRMGHMKGL